MSADLETRLEAILRAAPSLMTVMARARDLDLPDWLLFSGALAHTRMNWNVTAPSSGISVAWFYGAGVVFAVSAALILIEQMLRIITGKIENETFVGEENL